MIPKTQDEREREEEEYWAFLEREVGDLREVVSADGVDGNEGSVREEDQVNDQNRKTLEQFFEPL